MITVNWSLLATAFERIQGTTGLVLARVSRRFLGTSAPKSGGRRAVRRTAKMVQRAARWVPRTARGARAERDVARVEDANWGCSKAGCGFPTNLCILVPDCSVRWVKLKWIWTLKIGVAWKLVGLVPSMWASEVSDRLRGHHTWMTHRRLLM